MTSRTDYTRSRISTFNRRTATCRITRPMNSNNDNTISTAGCGMNCSLFNKCLWFWIERFSIRRQPTTLVCVMICNRLFANGTSRILAVQPQEPRLMVALDFIPNGPPMTAPLGSDWISCPVRQLLYSDSTSNNACALAARFMRSLTPSSSHYITVWYLYSLHFRRFLIVTGSCQSHAICVSQKKYCSTTQHNI
jgi:hypothetical protein